MSADRCRCRKKSQITLILPHVSHLLHQQQADGNERLMLGYDNCFFMITAGSELLNIFHTQKSLRYKPELMNRLDE